LRGVFLRRCGAKHRYRTRIKYLSHLKIATVQQHMPVTIYIDRPSLVDIPFPRGGKDGRKVIYLCGAHLPKDRRHRLRNIEKCRAYLTCCTDDQYPLFHGLNDFHDFILHRQRTRFHGFVRPILCTNIKARLRLLQNIYTSVCCVNKKNAPPWLPFGAIAGYIGSAYRGNDQTRHPTDGRQCECRSHRPSGAVPWGN